MMEKQNYPFLKLTTNEKFPRLLITRRPENKLPGQNIYGAFLPTGMVRRVIDLLARVFRLRPCELDIKGDFDAPCPEYFLHRCLAPCVEKICDRETYLEAVEMIHLVLTKRGDLVLEKIDRKIERLAEALEYERAIEWREARATVKEILQNAKWQIDAAKMNDVIILTDGGDSAQIHLMTLRRGKAVGRLDFQVDKKPTGEILYDFIQTFYQFYAPKQIFVPQDFSHRKILEGKLSENFNRRIKIIAHTPDKLPPSVFKMQTLAPHSFRYKKQKSSAEISDLLNELKQLFALEKTPRRIECFDVAHLAGREIVASRVAAVDGVLRREDGLVWEFENLSETAALAAAVEERLRLLPEKEKLPDLILLDGGQAQLNAVSEILRELNLKNLKIIGAVKPPQAHNQISHFLTAERLRVEFNKRSKALNFLQNLRDNAHTLANETHQQLHSLVQIFKNNETAPCIKYLLVPTRYAERGGDAEDLSPIRSLTQAGEIILKTKSKNSKT
ncbi:MAG: hypothetical protein ACR2HG_08775 [Pyrinomonadaceae bacterium]